MTGTRAELAQLGRLYKVSEAAMLLGVSPMTLYRRIKAGSINVKRVSERCTRITQAEFDRLLTEAGFFDPSPAVAAEPSVEAGAA